MLQHCNWWKEIPGTFTLLYMLAAQVAQRYLVTLWHVGTWVRPRQTRFFSQKKRKKEKKCPTGGERLNKSLVHKIRLLSRRGKGMAESFSREKLRHTPQKEGGWEILCDLPPVWPRLVRPTNLMSRMNGKKTHTHTTSPQGYSTTCIIILFHRLKIQPFHGITVLFKFIPMQRHQNIILTKGTRS